MKQKYFIVYAFTFLMLISCESNKNNKFENEAVDYDSTDISLQRLSLLKSQDYLTYKDSLIFLSTQRVYRGNKNIIVFFDRLNFYVTDLDLNVKKIISIKEKDYLIKGQVFDIGITNNELFILDASNIIKEISLKDGNEVNEIELEINSSEGLSPGAFNSMTNSSNDGILTTNIIQPFLSPSSSNEFELGKWFDLDGRFKTVFKIQNDKSDPNWFKFFDMSFASFFDGRVYFSFLISKKVFVFDLKAKLLNSYELSVDERYWSDIKTETSSAKIGEMTTTTIGSKFIVICNNGLQIKNGYVYSYIYQGNEKGPKLVKYNHDFKIIEELNVDEIKADPSGFKLYIIGDRLYLDNGIIHIFGKKDAK